MPARPASGFSSSTPVWLRRPSPKQPRHRPRVRKAILQTLTKRISFLTCPLDFHGAQLAAFRAEVASPHDTVADRQPIPAGFLVTALGAFLPVEDHRSILADDDGAAHGHCPPLLGRGL